MDKVVGSAAEAVADVGDGASLAVGGFGVCGVPEVLLEALLARGTAGLEVTSNNCGLDGWGLGRLLAAGRIRRVTASYVGANREFARQYLSGELEVELTPQGTLAERLRCGGAGIPAFYTASGVGTQVAEGGIPWRYSADGEVLVSSPPKPTRVFGTDDGEREFVLERAIVCDVALVHAWKGDRHGNLVYRGAAQNFNPVCAMSGRVTVAEVEHLVELGEIEPEQVHTAGIHVQRVVPLTPEQAAAKPIEQVTVRARPGDAR